MTITDPTGKNLSSVGYTDSVNFDWTSDMGGPHQICFSSVSRKDQQVEFKLTTGLEAIDYSDIVDEGSVYAVTKTYDKINQLTRQIQKQYDYNGNTLDAKTLKNDAAI